MFLYIASYSLSVRQGGMLSAIGLASKPAYRGPLSEPIAEKFYFPIHDLDRRYFRARKWDYRLEKILTEPFVPAEATGFLCPLHHRWRTNATVPILYGEPDINDPYFAALLDSLGRRLRVRGI